MHDSKAILAKLEKFKYPLLVLMIGLLILLLPTGASGKAETATGDERMEDLLSGTENIGRTMVLTTEHGVVVICQGADDPQVRLDIIRAIGSYTGFGSDKITVLKMAENR